LIRIRHEAGATEPDADAGQLFGRRTGFTPFRKIKNRFSTCDCARHDDCNSVSRQEVRPPAQSSAGVVKQHELVGSQVIRILRPQPLVPRGFSEPTTFPCKLMAAVCIQSKINRIQPIGERHFHTRYNLQKRAQQMGRRRSPPCIHSDDCYTVQCISSSNWARKNVGDG
jgi:hypothetical protein